MSSTSSLSDTFFSSVSLGSSRKTFQILDAKERLPVENSKVFHEILGAEPDCPDKFKVVTIIGNPGCGKSSALNKIFAPECTEVFSTFDPNSEEDRNSDKFVHQKLGVHACLFPKMEALVLDTEGIAYHSRRPLTSTNRLILKAMALSDVIIYYTTNNQLTCDVFEFLSGFVKIYENHLRKDLRTYVKKDGEDLNDTHFAECPPSLVVFHDSPSCFRQSGSVTPLDKLHQNAGDFGYSLKGFHKIEYVGGEEKGGNVVPTPSASSTLVVNIPQCSSRELNRSRTPPTPVFGSLESDSFVRVPEETESRFINARKVVYSALNDITSRQPRTINTILDLLKFYSAKYTLKVNPQVSTDFPVYNFMCPAQCLSCSKQCSKTMGHYSFDPSSVSTSVPLIQPEDTGAGDVASNYDPHYCVSECKHSEVYRNKLALCTKCLIDGHKRLVNYSMGSSGSSFVYNAFSSLLSGYVPDCPKCGIIQPCGDRPAVTQQHVHAWPGQRTFGYCTSSHTARQVREDLRETSIALNQEDLNNALEETNSLNTSGNSNRSQSSVTIRSIYDKVSETTRAGCDLISPLIPSMSSFTNPAYWQDDSMCTNCCVCNISLVTIHHCRQCGRGVCDRCSKQNKPVPARDYKDPVRVCNDCFPITLSAAEVDESGKGSIARNVAETASSAMSTLATWGSGILQATTQPDYWKRNELIFECCVCKVPFDKETASGVKYSKHHCRGCGDGVCDPCSRGRIKVKELGWGDEEVRVCNYCFKTRGNIDYQL